jgi:hypothetical protein
VSRGEIESRGGGAKDDEEGERRELFVQLFGSSRRTRSVPQSLLSALARSATNLSSNGMEGR